MKTIDDVLRTLVCNLNYEYSELEESCPELLDECKKELKDFAKEILKEAADKAELHKSYFLKAEDPEFYYKHEDDEDSYIHRDTNGHILGLDLIEVNKDSILNVIKQIK